MTINNNINIPNEMAILSQEKNYTVINDFVSHDKYLSEIIQLNPISRIALYKDKAQIVFSKLYFLKKVCNTIICLIKIPIR